MNTRAIQNSAKLFAAFLLVASVRLSAQSWQQVSALPADRTSALFVAGDTLFVGGFNKVYFTADGGSSWDSTAVVLPWIDFIEGLHCAEGRLFAGTVLDGVYSSSDGGQSWQEDNGGLVGLGSKNISGFAVRGDSIYVGTYGAKVFVKKLSTNSNWSAYNSGIPWFNIESITNIDGTLYAGSGGNATFSRQAYPGHTWTEIEFAEFSGGLNSFLGVIRQGDVLMAAGTLGLYRSEDGGADWTPFDPGTGVLGSARFIQVDNRVIANLAKPAALSYIKFTDDQGLNWFDFVPAPPGFSYDIAFYSGRLYLACENGLWRLPLTTRTEEPAERFSALGQNFPNPFTGVTTIPVELQRPARVELSLYDLNGRLIRTVWQGEKPAGAHLIEFDAGSLPAGLYFYRLAVDSEIEMKRLVVGSR